MTTTENRRINAQWTFTWVAVILAAWSIMLFGACGVVYGEWSDAVSDSAKAGIKVVDLAAQKDVVWLSLAAATVASLSAIVQTLLMFWVAISGVKAIDRMANHLNVNPWGKGHK